MNPIREPPSTAPPAPSIKPTSNAKEEASELVTQRVIDDDYISKISVNAVASVTEKLDEMNSHMPLVTLLLEYYCSAKDDLQSVRKDTLQTIGDMLIQKAKIITSVINNKPNAVTSLKESRNCDKKWSEDVKKWKERLPSTKTWKKMRRK